MLPACLSSADLQIFSFHCNNLLFDQKTQLVDGCGKWKASKPEWEFPYGICCPFTVPSDPIRKAWNWSERANGTHNFRLGMFVHLSRNPVFPGNFPFGKTKLVFPFTFQPKFPDFFVNGKQPLTPIFRENKTLESLVKKQST